VLVYIEILHILVILTSPAPYQVRNEQIHEMSKSNRIEGESLVASEEKLLREAIIDQMESSPNSGMALLINGRYFPGLAEKGDVLDAAEAFEVGASSCVDLRKTLGLPVVGSVGKLFLDASQELSNSQHHLNNPNALCEALIRALKAEIK
jgi:hypothetical protein